MLACAHHMAIEGNVIEPHVEVRTVQDQEHQNDDLRRIRSCATHTQTHPQSDLCNAAEIDPEEWRADQLWNQG